MKAVGRYLVVTKEKDKPAETKGGLLLAQSQKEDIRYSEATVISVGDEVIGISKNDRIYYDRHAGHQIEFDEIIYQVIKAQDVVVIL